jgi:hypothetical protein
LGVGMRSVISLVLAVLVGYSLSIVINASVSAATLVGFGIEISAAERVDMIFKEWIGLGSVYLPIYFVLHAVSFWVLGRVASVTGLVSLSNATAYALLGSLSLLALYLGFDAVMGSGGVVVASTRSFEGLFAHAATGAVSGFLFHRLGAQPDS